MSKIRNVKRSLLLLIGYALLSGTSVIADDQQNSSATATKTAVFAGGCFWCIQPAFDKAKGVIKTVVGYCGGTKPDTSYRLVSTGQTGCGETLAITYAPLTIPH